MIEGFNLVILTLMNWAHLFATVVWFGAMTTMFFMILPAAKVALEPPVMGKFMGILAKKMKTAVYISIFILVVTGALIAALNPSEAGFDLGSRVGMVLIVGGIYINDLEVAEYNRIRNEGCCGYVDKMIETDMGLIMIGFNYGH